MKKIRLFASALFLVLALLLLASCAPELATPQELSVDENNKLTWSAVESARTYTVEIKVVDGDTIQKPTRKTSYSLSDLQVGDYEIRVMATGGAKNDEVSAWSEVLYFHRDYESGCVYELINNNTEYQIKKGGSAAGTVIMEDTYRGKPVTAIAENAFKGNRNIVEVFLGNNIRSIGASAFYNCAQLKKVVIPDSLTSIGESAFQGCRVLEDVNIPAGITEIPAYCFAYCRALSTIHIGDNILLIGDSAFNGAALTAVTIPDSVVTVGEYAFSSLTELTSVTVGSGVVTMADYAVYDNPILASVTFAENSALTTLGAHCLGNNKLLSRVDLPAGLTDIGDFCFYQCEALESVTLPDSITHVGRLPFNATKIYTDAETDYVYAGKWLVAVKNAVKLQKLDKDSIAAGTVGICDYCFYNCPELETVVLPDSVQILGQYSFAYGEKLWKFETGTGLRVIQAAAFAQCKVLTRALMKKGLETIEDYAFYGCSLLDNNALEGTSMIPDTVTRVGMSAFTGTKLWSAPDESGVIYAGKWIVGYDENTNLGAVILKQGMTGVADYAFYKCTSLQSLQYLSDCKYIGEGAFYGCSSLATVTLNINLRNIPDFTFYKCTSLYQVSFPRQLTTIGRSAFYKCELLESLDFTSARNFTSIEPYAFYGCKNLKELALGERVSSIGEYAFYNCRSLRALEIPATIAVIPSHTFALCGSLETLSLQNGLAEIGESAFYKCAALSAIALPDSVVTVGKNAFYSCSNAVSLSLGNQLATVGDYAFFNLKNLSELRIPASLKSIGKYAFKGCQELHSVIIPQNVSEILNNAFYGCHNTTFYLAAETDESGWNSRWNSSNRPVFRNVTLSDDMDYVVSVTLSESFVSNDKKISDEIVGIHAPERSGFAFVGWTIENDTAVYQTEDLVALPTGTVVTALWTPETPSETEEPIPATESETETEN